MGARTLRSYLEQPLIDKEEIEKRLTAIEELNSQMITREELREYLNPIYDLERLIGRISYQTANPRDLIAFKASLEMLPSIRTLLTELKSPLMQEILEELVHWKICIRWWKIHSGRPPFLSVTAIRSVSVSYVVE